MKKNVKVLDDLINEIKDEDLKSKFILIRQLIEKDLSDLKNDSNKILQQKNNWTDDQLKVFEKSGLDETEFNEIFQLNKNSQFQQDRKSQFEGNYFEENKLSELSRKQSNDDLESKFQNFNKLSEYSQNLVRENNYKLNLELLSKYRNSENYNLGDFDILFQNHSNLKKESEY